MNKYANSVSSIITVVAFVCTNVITPDVFALTPSSLVTQQTFVSSLPQEVAKIELPKEIGRVEESFQGDGEEVVIVVQDAHAIPDAQRSIEKIIEHFQNNYGLNIIALEGASSSLDTQIFKSFPDKEKLKKVFQTYYEKGELTGSVAAAVLSDKPAVFHGVEDWVLFEKGLELYLEATKKQPELLQELEARRVKLEEEKRANYSQELLGVDQKLAQFYENQLEIPETLKLLAQYQQPSPGSELAVMLAEVSKQGDSNHIEIEVKHLAEAFSRAMRKSESSATRKKIQREFQTKNQEFATSQISPKEFGLWMKERAAEEGLKLKASNELLNQMGAQKKLRDIEGTKFFKDFERYAESVKRGLFRTDKEARLNKETKRLSVLKKLISLELTRSEWEILEKLQARRSKMEGKSGLSFLQASDLDLQAQYSFYENAVLRDGAFFDNLGKLQNVNAKRSAQSASLLVAGGFHAFGLTERLKAAGISHLLILPQINSVPDQTSYKDQMLGNVSWKNYFEVENGRVNLYKAFVRGTRDRLLGISRESSVDSLERRNDSDLSLTTHDTRLLKRWRDTVIRDLADQKQIDKSGDYTRFLDEIVRDKGPSIYESSPVEKINRFIDGLKSLKLAGRVTEQNIMNLAKSITIPGVAVGAAVAPRNEIRAQLLPNIPAAVAEAPAVVEQVAPVPVFQGLQAVAVQAARALHENGGLLGLFHEKYGVDLRDKKFDHHATRNSQKGYVDHRFTYKDETGKELFVILRSTEVKEGTTGKHVFVADGKMYRAARAVDLNRMWDVLDEKLSDPNAKVEDVQREWDKHETLSKLVEGRLNGFDAIQSGFKNGEKINALRSGLAIRQAATELVKGIIEAEQDVSKPAPAQSKMDSVVNAMNVAPISVQLAFAPIQAQLQVRANKEESARSQRAVGTAKENFEAAKAYYEKTRATYDQAVEDFKSGKTQDSPRAALGVAKVVHDQYQKDAKAYASALFNDLSIMEAVEIENQAKKVADDFSALEPAMEEMLNQALLARRDIIEAELVEPLEAIVLEEPLAAEVLDDNLVPPGFRSPADVGLDLGETEVATSALSAAQAKKLLVNQFYQYLIEHPESIHKDLLSDKINVRQRYFNEPRKNAPALEATKPVRIGLNPENPGQLQIGLIPGEALVVADLPKAMNQNELQQFVDDVRGALQRRIKDFALVQKLRAARQAYESNEVNLRQESTSLGAEVGVATRAESRESTKEYPVPDKPIEKVKQLLEFLIENNILTKRQGAVIESRHQIARLFSDARQLSFEVGPISGRKQASTYNQAIKKIKEFIDSPTVGAKVQQEVVDRLRKDIDEYGTPRARGIWGIPTGKFYSSGRVGFVAGSPRSEARASEQMTGWLGLTNVLEIPGVSSLFQINVQPGSEAYIALESLFENQPAGSNRYFVLIRSGKEGQEPSLIMRQVTSVPVGKRTPNELFTVGPQAARIEGTTASYSGGADMTFLQGSLERDIKLLDAAVNMGLMIDGEFPTQWSRQINRELFAELRDGKINFRIVSTDARSENRVSEAVKARLSLSGIQPGDYKQERQFAKVSLANVKPGTAGFMDQMRDQVDEKAIGDLDDLKKEKSVNLTYPLQDLPYLSIPGSSLHSKGVHLGFIEGADAPVAIKMFKGFADLDELIDAQILSNLGVASKFYGVVLNDKSEIIGYAMEPVLIKDDYGIGEDGFFEIVKRAGLAGLDIASLAVPTVTNNTLAMDAGNARMSDEPDAKIKRISFIRSEGRSDAGEVAKSFLEGKLTPGLASITQSQVLSVDAEAFFQALRDEAKKIAIDQNKSEKLTQEQIENAIDALINILKARVTAQGQKSLGLVIDLENESVNLESVLGNPELQGLVSLVMITKRSGNLTLPAEVNRQIITSVPKRVIFSVDNGDTIPTMSDQAVNSAVAFAVAATNKDKGEGAPAVVGLLLQIVAGLLVSDMAGVETAADVKNSEKQDALKAELLKQLFGEGESRVPGGAINFTANGLTINYEFLTQLITQLAAKKATAKSA